MVAMVSPAARSALSALASMQAQIDSVQTRLATGKRVNNPTDNPTAYFLAVGLSSRANSINALMTGITNTQSSITAATNGIAAIKALLTSAQTVANQALQSPQSLVTVTGANSSALNTSTQIASTGGSSTLFKSGDQVTVSDGTTTATYTASNGDTVQDLLDAVNGTSGLQVTASLNASGQIQLAATSNVNVTIGGTVTGTGTIPSVLSLVVGATNHTTNVVRSGLATQFNSLMTQIDQAAADAGFNGVNLLTGGSASVTLNETGSSTLNITGSQATSSALGVAAEANSFQLDTDISTALANIGNALNSLQAISASIGSMATIMQTRVDFNNAMVDTLNTGADSLVTNDANEDSAALLALQTRQQIAATSLSLTRNADSVALRLFGLG
jgi:flagellin-like hook-associated protein FlgL